MPRPRQQPYMYTVASARYNGMIPSIKITTTNAQSSEIGVHGSKQLFGKHATHEEFGHSNCHQLATNTTPPTQGQQFILNEAFYFNMIQYTIQPQKQKQTHSFACLSCHTLPIPSIKCIELFIRQYKRYIHTFTQYIKNLSQGDRK